MNTTPLETTVRNYQRGPHFQRSENSKQLCWSQKKLTTLSIKIQKESKKPDTLIDSYLSCVPFINTHWQGGFSDRSTKTTKVIWIIVCFTYTCTRPFILIIRQCRAITMSRNKRDITQQFPTRLRGSLTTAASHFFAE